MTDTTNIAHATIEGISYSLDRLPNGYTRITVIDIESGGVVGETVHVRGGEGAYDRMIVAARQASQDDDSVRFGEIHTRKCASMLDGYCNCGSFERMFPAAS